MGPFSQLVALIVFSIICYEKGVPNRWDVRTTQPIAALVGQSRKKYSPLVELLERLCHASIDVQEGSGHLNYINGYTTKASDALSFCIKPYAAKKVDHNLSVAVQMHTAYSGGDH